MLKKMGDTKRCCSFPQEFRPLWRKTRPPSVYLQTDSNQNRSWTSASCPLLLPVIHSHSRIVMHSQSPTNSRLRTLCRSMKHHIHRSSQIFTAYSWHPRSAFAENSELVSAGGWVDLKKVAKEDQDPGAPCLQLPKITKAACTDLLKLTYLLSSAMNEHWKKKLCESSKCKVELSLLKVVPLPRQNETRTLTIFGLFDVQYQTKMIYFLRWTTRPPPQSSREHEQCQTRRNTMCQSWLTTCILRDQTPSTEEISFQLAGQVQESGNYGNTRCLIMVVPMQWPFGGDLLFLDKPVMMTYHGKSASLQGQYVHNWTYIILYIVYKRYIMIHIYIYISIYILSCT